MMSARVFINYYYLFIIVLFLFSKHLHLRATMRLTFFPTLLHFVAEFWRVFLTNEVCVVLDDEI